MSMDAISEKIAHFIGAFELVEQETRMRAEYDEFRAKKAAEDDANAISLRSLKSKESYDLKDIDAGIKMKVSPPEPLKPGPDHEALPLANKIVFANSSAPPRSQEPERIDSENSGQSTTNTTFTLPAPGAMAQVTYQLNTLFDNDSYGSVSSFNVQSVSSLEVSLHSIHEVATSLSPIALTSLPTSAEWAAEVSKMVDVAAKIETGTNGSLHTSVLIGGAAQGIFIDGVAAAEFTPFEDLLPAYIAERQEQAEADNAPHDATTDGHDFDADFGSDESPFDDLEGHTVVTGANTLVNTASITSNWLDAEVIAVSGDVVRFDAVSQVNVVIDQDSVSGGLTPAQLAGQASTAVNAAAIGGAANAAAGPSGGAAAASLANAPVNWAVVVYDGPLIQVNWVTQYNFTTDLDQAVITTSGSETFLGMGENTLTNSVDALELGYQYDLILVGGNLIDINLINQTNVLLDSDVIDTTFPVAGGLDVSTGDNLTYNQAAIQSTGEDTDTEITQPYADVLDGFAQGSVEIPDEVVEDPVFLGIDLLRVLYIDGDFTTVNMVNQVNVLGDSDQVYLARDNFAAELQEQVTVTTGSNVLANVALIQDNGMDSIVMAQGETYSDALIHQANLIDTDVLETGSSIADLTNEAVAFLADDFSAEAMVNDITSHTNGLINDAFAQSDIMQTMLS